MKKNKIDQLDVVLTKVVTENIDEIDELDIDIPDMNFIFNNAKKEINDKSKVIKFEVYRNKKKRILKRATLVSSFLVVSFIFSVVFNSNAAEAFKFHVKKYILDMKNNMINISSRNDNPESLEEKDIDFIEHTLTLEQAKEKENFYILIPEYMPDGYKNESITWNEYTNGTNIIKQKYVNDDKSIIFKQQNNYDGEFNNIYEKNNNAKIIEENGIQWVLIRENDSVVTIYGLNGDLQYSIYCDISYDEAQKIIESIKKE